MRFALISDTREWREPTGRMSMSPPGISPDDVDQEARRRKGLLRLDEWQMQHYVTDVPMPDRIVQACRQIDLAATALSRLVPIPSDFDDDVYWPRIW